MSENETIKSLKWLIFNFPKTEKPRDDTERISNCINLYCQNAVNELNRQQKEIERLQYIKKHIEDIILEDCVPETPEAYSMCFQELIKKLTDTKAAKSEAIKESAERLKDRFCYDWFYKGEKIKEDIDDFVKKMVGDDNG